MTKKQVIVRPKPSNIVRKAAVNGFGDNHLGKILMDIRDTL